MDHLIDFTSCEPRVNNYEGADFKKKVIYDGRVYMLKFGEKLESDEKKPLQASYSNAPVSEYLGSHIFEMIGIPAQHTLLGTYENKTVVACLDFIQSRPNADDLELLEFKKLENSYLESSTAGGRTPTYENLMAVLDSHTTLSGLREAATERYWQVFAVDALIGNFDRHAGNWGYILNKRENQLVGLAPVYDCGSSFYPRLNETAMADMLSHPQKIEERTRIFPRAALRLNGQKVFYHEFLLSPEGEQCRAALIDLYPKIDLHQIHRLINETPGISNIRRDFYSAYIDIRHEVILKPAYEMALERHHEREHEDYNLSAECRDCKKASAEFEHSEERGHGEKAGHVGHDR